MYFFHYYVGNTELTAVIAGVSTFVPLLGTLTVPLLARRMKKRHVYLVASAVNLLGMGMMMLSGTYALGLIVGAVILSLGAGQRTAIYFSMQADPVDYGVWKTGINTAGILTSINGFLGKVAMAGAGAITGALLSSGGYIANQAQSDSALLAIKACYLYIPALLILASMLWMAASTASTITMSRSVPTLMPDAAPRQPRPRPPENPPPCKAPRCFNLWIN